MAKTMIKVTQTKSTNGRLKNHKACVAGLGLRRIEIKRGFGKGPL